MKVKITDKKIAQAYGKKVGATVEIEEWQLTKWIVNGWGVEAKSQSIIKEEKPELETKELKVDKETKDATD